MELTRKYAILRHIARASERGDSFASLPKRESRGSLKACLSEWGIEGTIFEEDGHWIIPFGHGGGALTGFKVRRAAGGVEDIKSLPPWYRDKYDGTVNGVLRTTRLRRREDSRDG